MSTAASNDKQLPDFPVVSTFAGSGKLGITDGPASSASFIAPVGIAFGSQGELFVADRDAQRLRVVSPDGNVRTLAGSGPLVPLGIGVAGGFRNGNAVTARFSSPQAVVELADHRILIADTGNACIRSYRNGVVDTYAGACMSAGNADGVRSAARFAQPRSLAKNDAGIVFIADPGNGVRRIGPDGRVSTLDFEDSKDAISVAIAPGDNDHVFVGTPRYFDTIDATSGKRIYRYGLETNFSNGPANREGVAPAGPIAALGAFTAHDFVMIDPLSSAVRFGQTLRDVAFELRTLSRIPSEDSAFSGTDFTNGANRTATFRSPFGVAIAHDGSVAVADTGNRRIRRLSPFNRYTHISVDNDGGELPSGTETKPFTVAYVGNSDVWFNQAWRLSMAGTIEEQLHRLPDKKFAQARVIPIMRQGVSPLAALNLVDSVLADGLADIVILDLPGQGQCLADPDRGNNFPPGWKQQFVSALNTTAKDLRASHVKLFVLYHPGSLDFPSEAAYRKLTKGTKGSGAYYVNPQPIARIQSDHDEFLQTIRSSQATIIDEWPAFLAAYEQPERHSLYNVWDHHMTAFGRSLVVNGVIDAIKTDQGK